MPTAHPRTFVTLCNDAHDRLTLLAACWGVPLSGLLRCMADRLAEELQTMPGPGGTPLWVRGGPLPLALLQLCRADADPARDAVEVMGDLMSLYATDGAGPAVTFRPADATVQEVVDELGRLCGRSAEDCPTGQTGGARNAQAAPPARVPPYRNTGVGSTVSHCGDKVIPMRKSRVRP